MHGPAHLPPIDEQRDSLDTLELVCRQRIAPRAREADARGELPAESWRELADAGYFGLFHPEAVGGRGADGTTCALAMERLARACAGTFWSATISTVLCGKLLADLFRPAHHQRWLRGIATGEIVGCFAASEDGAGSDPAGSYRVTLRRAPAGGGFVLDGEKSRISNAGSADVAVVFARLEDGERRGMCYAVVDLRRPGVVRAPMEAVGLRAMPWGRLRFEQLAIDEEDVITDASVERTLATVEWGQLIQAWSSIGIAQAAFDLAVEHACTRHAFGRPIGHLPTVHGRLADVRAEIDAARLLALEVTALKCGGGQGGAAREAVITLKVFATEMAVRATESILRTLGGWGVSRDHDIERLHRDSLCNVPAGLPSDRLRELLGCALTGVDGWSYSPLDWLQPAGWSFTP